MLTKAMESVKVRLANLPADEFEGPHAQLLACAVGRIDAGNFGSACYLVGYVVGALTALGSVGVKGAEHAQALRGIASAMCAAIKDEVQAG